MSRRKLLHIAGVGAVAIAVPGCGGSGGGGTPTGPPGAGSPGATNGSLSGIGLGNGTALVLTAFQRASPISPNGSFSTTVSASTVHQVLVTDSTGKLRGLALSIPGQLLVVNPESCLLGLLFLTPGLLDTDPVSAKSRISQLQGQGSYATALQYLTARLTTVALQDVVSDGTFSGLLATCVQEYAASQVQPSGINNGTPVDGFLLTYLTSNNEAWLNCKVSNGAWRFIRVDRVDYTVDGAVNNTYPVGVFPGAKPASVGSLLSGKAGEVQTFPDPTVLDFTKVAYAEYWIQGPGKAGSHILPASVASDDVWEWGVSVVYYLLFSMIDILGGLDSFKIVNLADIASQTLDAIGGVNALGGLSQAVQGGDWSDIEAAVIDFLIAVGPLVLETPSLISALLISPELAALLVKLLSTIELAIGTANLIIARIEWQALTERDVFTISETGTGTITINVTRK